jgi:hypothetical protein
MGGDAMNRRRNRREPDGFADRLRREASRERPRFSRALHERILERLPGDVVIPGEAHAGEPRPVPARRRAWREVGLPVGLAALAAVVIAGFATGPDSADEPPRGAVVASIDPAGGDAVAGGVPPEASELGIDTVPTFDDLEAGVREGVSTLAATLLDVPEWRMLADFDAAGFLGPDAAP